MEPKQPRELTAHKVNVCNNNLNIIVLDEPGSGGARHAYRITGFDTLSNPSNPMKGVGYIGSTFLFQNGPIGEVGINGITHEALIAILIDRLEGFQSGPYQHADNADALWHLQKAMEAMHRRTKERAARGVEGTHEV